jgi:myo-inositol catabolism protein IolC
LALLGKKSLDILKKIKNKQYDQWMSQEFNLVSSISWKIELLFNAVCVFFPQDKRTLKQSQRFVAFYILNELYRAERPNPFMAILVEVYTDGIL